MTRTLRSNGETKLALYVAPYAPPAGAPGAVDDGERVTLCDPRSTETVELRALALRRGPRNPEQRTLRSPEPRVELPDGRPLTRAQRVLVPPELMARWRREHHEKGAR